MLNIIGIFIIILGFFPIESFYGYIPDIIFFWFGTLLVLQPNEKIPYLNSIIKPARIGLLVNVVVLGFGLFFLSYLIYTLPQGKMPSWFISLVVYAITPFQKLADLFFPQPMQTFPDGSVAVTTTFLRAAVISFLNLMLYVSVSVIVSCIMRNNKNKKGS